MFIQIEQKKMVKTFFIIPQKTYKFHENNMMLTKEKMRRARNMQSCKAISEAVFNSNK